MTGKTTDGNPAPGSNAGDGTNDYDQSSTPSGPNDGGKGKDGGDGEGGAAGGRGDGGDKGGKDGAVGGGKEAGVEGGAPLTVDSENASSDSSSPLVPILIALAVLAAISIGVVAMRKKREDADSGAPASTEAG